MKKYILLAPALKGAGGTELYLLRKTEWLMKNGYDITVIHSNGRKGEPVFKGLCRFQKYSVPAIYFPTDYFSSIEKEHVIKKIIKLAKCEKAAENGHSIIVESIHGITALWGELLASRLNAKHMIAFIYELNAEAKVAYLPFLPFYSYKFDRKEFCARYATSKILFEGYRDIAEKDSVRFLLNEDPMADVSFPRLREIKDGFDYSICYLGRTNKDYVPRIMSDVVEFAKRLPDKKIQLVMIGAPISGLEKYSLLFKQAHNLSVLETGILVPLPRELFKKTDVVIAGAGAARAAVSEGCLTIVADTENCLSNGLLGYDTGMTFGHEPELRQMSFTEALTRVLIDHVQDNMPYNPPKYLSVDECCRQNIEVISASVTEQKYYDVDSLKRTFSLKKKLRHRITALLCFLCPDYIGWYSTK